MELSTKAQFLPRKVFRKLQKKNRRKFKRQQKAQEESEKNKINQEIIEKEAEALYLVRLEQELEESRIQNQLWHERELQAQQEFARKRKEEEARESAKAELIKQQTLKHKEKLARIQANILRDFLLQEQIDEFLNGSPTIPDELLKNAESNPGREVCSYFRRSGCCKYGDPCIKNHIRPGISKIILITNFFDHPRLRNVEVLETEDNELEEAFHEFFCDACYELEKFGNIERFFVCSNTLAHLRGKAFVEYSDMRFEKFLLFFKLFDLRIFLGKH